MALLRSWSARVRPMATGAPVVPDVTCRRTSSVARRAQVLAEGRVALLAGAQLVLGRVGEGAEVVVRLEPLGQLTQLRAVERRAVGQVGELAAEGLGAHAPTLASPRASC